MHAMKRIISSLLLASGLLLHPVVSLADFNDGVVAYLQGDYQRAYDTMRSLAETTEQPYANYYLGMMYLNGQGVKQDYAEAGKWFRKAAELHIPQAQYKLGWLYMSGQGLPRDFEQAYAWFRVGAAFQHKKSVDAIADARQQLSETELQEADKLSDRLIHDFGPEKTKADASTSAPAAPAE